MPKQAIELGPNGEQYWACDEYVKAMAEDLAEKYHWDAAQVKIFFLFRAKHTTSKGKPVAGTCTKQSEKQKLAHGYDYFIELAYDIWSRADERIRGAILLHELKHIKMDEEDCKTDPHDFEEFLQVIEVFGLYHSELEKLAVVVNHVSSADIEKKVEKVLEKNLKVGGRLFKRRGID